MRKSGFIYKILMYHMVEFISYKVSKKIRFYKKTIKIPDEEKELKNFLSDGPLYKAISIVNFIMHSCGKKLIDSFMKIRLNPPKISH